jgi:hypothetical protein
MIVRRSHCIYNAQVAPKRVHRCFDNKRKQKSIKMKEGKK